MIPISLLIYREMSRFFTLNQSAVFYANQAVNEKRSQLTTPHPGHLNA